ncbi:hypothetical protein [Mycoplasmopsis cynos]|uniref:hypothetical protein n=3 Tax=Mycoplasmopsis cynos TaxID=171284 RepID=UPI0021FA2F88|nr:hypothetical protein [Mycoplasmopsis cynos]UWV77446.1 hypothetical protein NW070_00470 [Mycoplasmopsis cynos]UWV92161.1 hypothetical protein NWE57_04555 [Mycoplasmopsis cynos]WAM07891.1 hypothetical protein ONA21_00720 [Mycoplasmopsis cynos]WQQ18986.1 hypothetical protein RRG44_02605 [Mycoplasmopsis cynos]
MKKWKHLMLLPILVSPVILSSCQNIYAKKVEPKKVKTMSLQNKWIISTAKDFVKDYKPGNLKNQIHTDDVTFSKYKEVPYFIYEAFKDLLFGQNSNGRYRVIPYDQSDKFRKHFNIVNEDYKEAEINFKNVFDEKAFNYLQSFVKLKDEKKVELNNVNKDSFKDKVQRLKKDNWVYSKTQDYISKTQDTRTYDFENQRNSYLDNFYNTEIVRSGLIEPVTIDLDDLDYKFVLLINDWETKYRTMLKQGKPITLEMLKDWFKIYYDYYKVLNEIDNNKNDDEGYSLLNVDKASAIFNKQKKEYDHNFLNAYDYKTDTFKDAKYSFSKDDYEIRIQKNNEFNQGSKLRFSTNINAKNNLATRNVQLFKDNTSQGSLALIDKNFQAYIVTSRHSLYQRLVKYYKTENLDEYEKNDTSSKNTYFTTKTTYSDLFTTNEKQKGDFVKEISFQAQTMYDNDDYFASSINGNKYDKHNAENTKQGYILDPKTNQITRTWDYTLTLLLNDYSKKDIKLSADNYKVLYNPMWDNKTKEIDQVLIKVDLSKQPNEIKELLKQNRAYLNPMKLTSELLLNKKEQIRHGTFVFNPQTYFVNEDIKDNFKDIIVSDFNEYKNIDYKKTYWKWVNKTPDDNAKEKDQYDLDNLDELNLNQYVGDLPKYNSKNNLIEVDNDWQKLSFFKNFVYHDNQNVELHRGRLFKGWDDYLKTNQVYQKQLYDKKYRFKYLGIDLKQSEIFNVYDFISNQYYYTSSNVFHSETDYNKYNPIMSKVFLGYFYPGVSGTGLMNTKYEISDDISNKNTNDTDPNIFKDNFNVANASQKTDQVAYDEMKYMIVAISSEIKNGDISKNNLVDFQNTPIGLGKAIMIDDGLVKAYNQILDELVSKE